MQALFDPLDLAIVALVFVPLERLIPQRREQKLLRRGWPVDLAHFLISAVISKFGIVTLVAALLLLGARHIVPADLKAAVAAQPFWLAFVEIMIIADLGFYAAHRLFHAVPWLWRFHAVHHSIEEMDWLAAHRVHPIDQILTQTASLLPVMAMGFAPGPILLFGVVYHWQSLLIHSNARVPFGPLRWVLASPQFHHWHHANEPEAIDKNFSGQLPVIDWLFGTMYMPDRMPSRVGTNDPVPLSYGGHMFYPLAALWRDWRGAHAAPREDRAA